MRGSCVRALRLHQVDSQRGYHRTRNLVLNSEDVVKIAIECLRPKVLVGFCTNQLRGHSQSVAGLADAAFEHVGNTQFTGDRLQPFRPALEVEGRRTRDDPQARRFSRAVRSTPPTGRQRNTPDPCLRSCQRTAVLQPTVRCRARARGAPTVACPSAAVVDRESRGAWRQRPVVPQEVRECENERGGSYDPPGPALRHRDVIRRRATQVRESLRPLPGAPERALLRG